jgi:putative MATE family efflux protein
MNLAQDSIKSLYLRFLINAFGAALVASVFGVVDMAMMGHYQGPSGPAALAIISPIWNLVYSLGLLTGIGASVIYAAEKGADKKEEDPNESFTIGLILTLVICGLEALLLNVFLEPLLRFFGADDESLRLCLSYLSVIRWGFPLFTLSNYLASFLRNDKAPGLATAGVISGGAFNIVFDYVFIFVCNMGMEGAGLATVLGMVLNDGIMCAHFFSKNNTLRLVPFRHYLSKSLKILSTGFASFFVDAAMGIVNIAFNRQIIRFFPSQASSYLAIYGVALNLFIFVQASSYGIGQASQPLWSFNYGAGLYGRVKKVLLYALFTCLSLSVFSLILTESIPNQIISVFMTPTEEVVSLVPSFIRPFCSCFMLLPLNVVSCYFFSAILKDRLSLTISVLRGALIPVICLYTLPFISPNLLFYCQPFTELLIGIPVGLLLFRFSREMEKPTFKKEEK